MTNKINTFKHFLLFTAILFTTFSVFAFEPHEKEQSQAGAKEGDHKFNAGELIIEHITDSHEWHIVGHLALPLPVILYSSDKGLSVFLSNKLEGGEEYNGYKLVKNKIVAVDLGVVDEAATAKLWDISITKNVATILIAVFLMLWVFLSLAKTYAKNKNQAPKGIQTAMEFIIIFVRDDVAKASLGEKKYQRYMPFLLTVFFFILISNLLGLIPFLPGGANVTGNIAVTMTLAVFTFIITMVSSGKYYWKHVLWMPGVPVLVRILILTPIEILGVFLKPFVLMIRLFANMLAGHIVALSFFSMIFIFAEMNAGVGVGVAIFSWAFTVFMFMLELLVAFLQAYVFTLLSAIYFAAALEEDHHAHSPEVVVH